ncbi:hypothetical protein [Flavobacterium gilvum]|uniref:Uncharacterized protein n=1 Tax=Flavobacterium gilvum TaxID=1492737 RepID=A0AAC9I8Y9_9FLAO|nr:hypothetical protein [Flavobacterium gilvum]AOW10472.1 hypothetical protein EM308_13715 [Flavobacterium gilvum]KFC61149.1 hypothetical protein FEM08_00850 [Flavobacterium gilvum]
MKYFEIYIDEDLDIKSKTILNDYWIIDEGNFLNKPAKIVQTYDITLGELTKLVKKHSCCEITHGNCRECKEVMMEKVAAQTVYMSSMRNKIHTCSKCQIELRKKAEKQYQDRLEEIRKMQRLNFEIALIDKKWTELPANELSMLYSLIQNKTKKNIYANVFKGNCFDKTMWNYVKKFENLGFLNVIRDGNSVVEFEFDERINEVIKNLFLKKTDADLYSDSSVSNILRFSLTKKEYKKTDRDPDYGGIFTLPGDIILKANTRYIFGGWTLTDGSINLSFTPLADLQKSNVTQENIENEPQLIGDIVKNMFNEIRDDTRELPTYDQAFGSLDSNFYENEDEDEDDDWDVPF